MRGQGTHKACPHGNRCKWDRPYNSRVRIFLFYLRVIMKSRIFLFFPMSLSRAFQWVGVAAILLVLVGLNYEFESKAGMQMNAAPESPLSQSLRGYWKLDDGSGTNATDASGNGNTLAMTGSPSWATGQIGPYALDFSGTAQYLSVADPSSGVLDIGDSTDFSITGWFNRDTFANDHTIVAKRNSSATNTDAGYIVWIDAAADKLNFTVGDGGGTSGDQYTLASASTFTATGWHQFAAVWDDSLGMQLYIDGKLDNSTTSSTSSIGSLANAVAFRIGAESDAGNPFDGKLDDIRIYGYALSADQVKKVYNTTSPTQPIDTSLVGHWTFDGLDIQGTTAIDRSSYGNNGTITGTTKTIGKLGQALSFNGSSDYVNTSFVFGPNTMTVSLWEKASDTNADYYLITSNLDADNKLWDIYITNGSGGSATITLEYVRSNGGYYDAVSTTSPISAGVWNHIVVVYNVTNVGTGSGTLALYVNGSNVSLSTNSFTDWFGIGSPQVQIGKDRSGYFKGTLDDVRMYNRALTGAEISNLYNIAR